MRVFLPVSGQEKGDPLELGENCWNSGKIGEYGLRRKGEMGRGVFLTRKRQKGGLKVCEVKKLEDGRAR